MLSYRAYLQPKRLLLIVAAGVIVGGLAFSSFMTSLGQTVQRWMHGQQVDGKEDGRQPRPRGAALVHNSDGPTGLKLTEAAIASLQIRPVAAETAVKPRPLAPQFGTLNYDNDGLFAIRPRFSGELVEVMGVPDPAQPPYSPKRPLRSGDRVKPGEVLAVLWCKDLGEKKAALVDSLVNLRFSEDLLGRHQKLYAEGAIALGTLKATETQVQRDRNASDTAERTLRMWKLTEPEISEIRREAKAIANKEKKRDPEQEKNWARVEVRVPETPGEPDRVLTVVEKNTNITDMVDPARDQPLFRLADLSRLQIWVHVPEEFLPMLRERMKKASSLSWRIKMQGEKSSGPEADLPISQIASAIDPLLHTALVMGYLPNPDGRYLVGQFVSATILVPPPDDAVEIPTDALNQVDGENVVFVQSKAHPDVFFFRRVVVLNASRQTTLIRSKLTPEDEKTSQVEKERNRHPLRPLLPDEKVVTRGVIELTAALDDLVNAQSDEQK